MLKLLLFIQALADEGTGHSHGPEFSSTQIIGTLIITVLAIGVMFFLSKKNK